MLKFVFRVSWLEPAWRILEAIMKGILLTSIICILLPFNALGQQPSLDWSSVPTNYGGQNITDLYSALLLDELTQSKRESETTAEFEKRIANVATAPLGTTGLTRSSLFAFIVSSSILSFKSQYDADQKNLRVNIGIHPVRHLGEVLYFGFFIEMSDSSLDSRHVKYVLAMNNPTDFTTERFPTEMKFDLPMESDRAKAAKSNTAVMYICRLVAPYRALDPYGEVISRYLIADVEQIVFFNKATGEVYKKIAR